MFRRIVSRVVQVFSRRARNARSFTATGRSAVLTRGTYFAIRLTQLILKRSHPAIVAITHSRRGLLCTLGTPRTRCFGRRRLPAHWTFFARCPITGVVKPRFAFNACWRTGGGKLTGGTTRALPSPVSGKITTVAILTSIATVRVLTLGTLWTWTCTWITRLTVLAIVARGGPRWILILSGNTILALWLCRRPAQIGIVFSSWTICAGGKIRTHVFTIVTSDTGRWTRTTVEFTGRACCTRSGTGTRGIFPWRTRRATGRSVRIGTLVLALVIQREATHKKKK